MKIKIQLNYDFPKNASAFNQNEECHYNVNKSDFVSTNSDSEKVPLIDKFTTQIVFKPSKGIFWFFYKNIKRWLMLFCMMTVTSALSQQSITITGTPVMQDFNSMGTSSTAILPTGFKMGTDWSTGATVTTQAAGTSGTGIVSSSSAGGFYNFANGITASSTDRAIGFLTSGSYSSPRSIIYAFTNNTGITVTSLSISWNYEKYRSGTRTLDWTFFHGSTFIANTAATVGNQSYAADANNTTVSNPPAATAKSLTVNGLSIPDGTTYYLRWTYTGNGGSTNAQGLGLDDFSITLSSCNAPNQLSFITQPSNVNQNTAMSPAVQVAATCSDGTIASGYSGSVTLIVNSPGCGYTSQTVTFINGVATFSNIIFLRSPQTNLSFTATSIGLTSATSTSFNVDAPTGAPIVTTIAQNDFDANVNWNYTTGTDVTTGSSGTPGVGVVGVVNHLGNNVLRKSYSVNNGSGELGCSNTVTFGNQSPLSAYNIVDFSFNLLSFGIGACGFGDGCGVESDEELVMQVSTDGGTIWNTILTKKGFNNCLFGITSSPITSLSMGSSPVYTSGSCDTKSAFTLSMSGISQFQFRFTANNNRTEENWAIDNIKLTGTTYGVGTPFNLPTVNLGSDLNFCSGNSQELSATVSSFQPDLSYSWSPSTGLTTSNISNPVVSELSAAQTYTLTVTDGHGCIASDQVVVTPKFVKLSPIAFD
jgi:hypothetical protein